MYLLHDLIDRIFRRYIFVIIDGPTLHIWLFLYSIKINGNVNRMLSNAKKDKQILVEKKLKLNL